MQTNTNIVVVAVIGMDQPGVIACVSSVMTRLGCNIVEMTQSTLRDQFAGTEHTVTDEIQLVISDIEMPDMDGHSLTAHIRNDTSMRNMPVILFSSLITEALRAKGERVGADRQVSKPDLPRLNKIIKELITEKFGNRHLGG